MHTGPEGVPPTRRCLLPNILVYIDVRQGLPTPPALFALSEARRVARLAGASVYAVAVTAPLNTDALERLAGPVGQVGADKLLLCEADDFAGPVIDVTHGRGLDAAVARVAPLLILFPAGGAGAALGPPLAARLGGPFAPWCDFLTTDAETPTPEGSGRVQLIHCRPDGRSRRRLDPLQLERAVVATLGAGRPPRPSGNASDLEIEVLASGAKTPAQPTLVASAEELLHRTQWQTLLPLASIVVLVGDGEDGGPLVSLAALRQAASADTIVERAAQVPSSLLAACCPDVLLKVGHSSAQTARSPRTRVVLAVVAPGPADPAVEDVDVLWQFQSRDEMTSNAVAAFLAEIGPGP